MLWQSHWSRVGKRADTKESSEWTELFCSKITREHPVPLECLTMGAYGGLSGMGSGGAHL